MTPDELTEAARRIRGFGDLPMATQVTLLYGEISAAQQSRIPIALICEALNAAGSKISSKYFRDVMPKVRRRMAKLDSQEVKPLSAPQKPEASKPESKPAAKESPRLPSSKAREEKANAYMGSDNPLLNQLGKKD